jgi:LacI family transcriptional regulator
MIRADFQFDGGYAAARKLLTGAPPPTAIFACNDLMAIGAIRAALDLGYQVPDNLSIVGFDDISMASFSNPALTTVNHPKYDMGFLAASMLIERIRDDSLPPRKEVLPTELILRQSTRKQD